MFGSYEPRGSVEISRYAMLSYGLAMLWCVFVVSVFVELSYRKICTRYYLYVLVLLVVSSYNFIRSSNVTVSQPRSRGNHRHCPQLVQLRVIVALNDVGAAHDAELERGSLSPMFACAGRRGVDFEPPPL